jgi:2-hydroxychromene-2-carboxylate isomerase
MPVQIETYYDFRSPYAYFADYRIRKENLDFGAHVEWIGRPIFIDVILNLQAGREPWATYADTLIPPKRAYLMADIRRMAEFYGAPYRPSWKWPARPNQIPALCIASLLRGKTEETFRNVIFDALWQEQRDIADPAVLRDALVRAGGDLERIQPIPTRSGIHGWAEACESSVANRGRRGWRGLTARICGIG